MSNELLEAIEDAKRQGKYTFDCAKKNPFDHGFAMIKGLDGRTTLARKLKTVDGITVERSDYHGTTVTLDGVSRYLSAQRGAYDAFIKTLQEHGIDQASDMYVWGHGT